MGTGGFPVAHAGAAHVFYPNKLSGENFRSWMERREDMQNFPAVDIDQRAGRSKASKRKNGPKSAAAAPWEMVD